MPRPTKDLNGLRKYIRAKLIQESGQNPYSNILKENKDTIPVEEDIKSIKGQN